MNNITIEVKKENLPPNKDEWLDHVKKELENKASFIILENVNFVIKSENNEKVTFVTEIG